MPGFTLIVKIIVKFLLDFFNGLLYSQILLWTETNSLRK
jgi:hypothetical protein